MRLYPAQRGLTVRKAVPGIVQSQIPRNAVFGNACCLVLHGVRQGLHGAVQGLPGMASGMLKSEWALLYVGPLLGADF